MIPYDFIQGMVCATIIIFPFGIVCGFLLCKAWWTHENRKNQIFYDEAN